MEMDMNLGGIMVKISRVDFFMVADNVHSYGYSFLLVIQKGSFRGQPNFLVPRCVKLQARFAKNKKLKNENKQ